MDGSSKTPLLENGQGGRCLNDATMKGRVDTLNLLNMLLRFFIGQVAFTGDLKQFYPSIALDQSQWNLQRVLWREGMSFDSPIEEIVIMVLIFGGLSFVRESINHACRVCPRQVPPPSRTSAQGQVCG